VWVWQLVMRMGVIGQAPVVNRPSLPQGGKTPPAPPHVPALFAPCRRGMARVLHAAGLENQGKPLLLGLPPLPHREQSAALREVPGDSSRLRRRGAGEGGLSQTISRKPAWPLSPRAGPWGGNGTKSTSAPPCRGLTPPKPRPPGATDRPAPACRGAAGPRIAMPRRSPDG